MIEQLRASVANHRDEMAKLVAVDTENPRRRRYEQCLHAVVYALTAARLLSP